MTISKSFKRIIAAGVILGGLATSAIAADGPTNCLPAGPGAAGLGTNVGFPSTWYSSGHFKGIRVTKLLATSHSIKITKLNGQVLFSGPVSVGQFIPFPSYPYVHWTGYKSSYGTHMNGICVISVYE